MTTESYPIKINPWTQENGYTFEIDRNGNVETHKFIGFKPGNLTSFYTELVGSVPGVAPEIVAPEIVAPEIVAPEIVAPEIVAPEIGAPEIVAPEIVAPEIVAPEIVADGTVAVPTPAPVPASVPASVPAPVIAPGAVSGDGDGTGAVSGDGDGTVSNIENILHELIPQNDKTFNVVAKNNSTFSITIKKLDDDNFNYTGLDGTTVRKTKNDLTQYLTRFKEINE